MATESYEILVVDDEAAYGELISDVADLSSIKALATTNSQMVEYLLQTHQTINLIFLDLNMPYRDGIEVMRGIAESGYSGTLVLMSGFDESVLATANQLAEEHRLNLLPSLMKPFSIKQIQNTIQEYSDMGALPDKSRLKPKYESLLSLKELQDAFDQDRIEIHYQPQISLSNYEVVGFECLVRLVDQQQQLIYPNRFIETVETHNLNKALLQLVIRHVTEDIHQYFNSYNNQTFSINLSGLDLDDLSLPDMLFDSIQNNHLQAENIVIEITETRAIQQLRTGLDVLARLRLKGFQLSIDDFGTGTAVLANIKNMPFSELKIDKTFVDKLLTDNRTERLIEKLCDMSHSLKLKIVAEGVEYAETVIKLKELGCDIVQGYYFSKPLDARSLMQFMEVSAELINKNMDQDSLKTLNTQAAFTFQHTSN